MIEAAISFALSETIKIAFSKYNPEGNVDLQKVFSLLETSNKSTGKIAFLKGLDIPYEKYRGFIQHLSKMRNKMVHNIENVGMTIKTYYNALQTDKDDFRDKMTFAIDKKVDYKDKKLDKMELFELNPKIAIWYIAVECILELYSLVKIFEIADQTEGRKEDISKIHKDFFDKFSPIITEYLKSRNT